MIVIHDSAQLTTPTVAFTVDEHPSQLLRVVKCQQKVRDRLQTLYPGVKPQELRKAWEDDYTTISFSLTPEMNEADILSGLVTPPLVVVQRYDRVYERQISDRFVELYDAFVETAPKHISKNADPRSSTLAFHLGIWQFTNAQPKITRESREQEPATIKAMDDLLQFVKAHLVPKINNRLRYDFPDQWRRALK